MFGSQITQKEALKLIPGQSQKRLEELVKKHKLFVASTGKNSIYIKESLHLAINVEYIKSLYEKYGTDWLKMYLKLNEGGYDNPVIMRLTGEDILNNRFGDLYFSEEETANDIIRLTQPLKEEVDLSRALRQIQPRVVRNVSIKVFCKDCRFNIDSQNGEEADCNHPAERQVYRARYVVPNEMPRRSIFQNLEAREIDDAIIEAKVFKANCQKKELPFSEEERPVFLPGTIDLYHDYIENKDGKHTLNTNTKNHISDIKRNLRYMVEGLNANNINVNRLMTDRISREMGQKISVYMYNVKNLKGSHSRVIGQLSSFFNWAIGMKRYNMANPFFKIERMKNEIVPVALEMQTFNRLLEMLASPAPYFDKPNDIGFNQAHCDWLRKAFLLSVFTGRRREELVTMRWSFINRNQRGTLLIKGDNCKIVKQKKQGESQNKRKYTVPLYPELLEFLNNLGLQNKRDTDDFILFPECEQGQNRLSRLQMMEKLSRSFAFLIKFIEHDQGKVSFKSIRKIYTSKARTKYGSNAGIITDHLDGGVISKHYHDTSEFLEHVAKTFYIFDERSVLPDVLPRINQAL